MRPISPQVGRLPFGVANKRNRKRNAYENPQYRQEHPNYKERHFMLRHDFFPFFIQGDVYISLAGHIAVYARRKVATVFLQWRCLSVYQ